MNGPPLGLLAISSWEWITDNRSKILDLLLQHVQLTVIAVAVGFVISFPVAVYAYRHRVAYLPATWITGLLYTIPSLALFVLLLPITGLSITTVEVGLVSYTLLILIRNTVVGLRGVPEDVKDSARGMGFTESQLLWKVELPLALPAIVAGIRIATVSTIGLATVGALIGRGGLGKLILDGLAILYATEYLLGALLSVALALVADGLLLVGQRLLTPWARRRTSLARMPLRNVPIG